MMIFLVAATVGCLGCNDDDPDGAPDAAAGKDAAIEDAGAADTTADATVADTGNVTDARSALDTGQDPAPDLAQPDIGKPDTAASDAGSVCDPKTIPKCIEALIKKLEGEPVANPPGSLTQYEYKGQCVYYYPPVCCDQFSAVYDGQCNVLCGPDGGFTGDGDGKCPDFHAVAKKGPVIWKDPRTKP